DPLQKPGTSACKLLCEPVTYGWDGGGAISPFPTERSVKQPLVAMSRITFGSSPANEPHI
ncbi:hypothetical protein, partial [Methylobacterium sp. Leaf118]|uniref:hypothetical protein n=1 Tax=Methylobacterium sp. Leaf118 TaxID=2876562 RepID=UPI001E3085F7